MWHGRECILVGRLCRGSIVPAAMVVCVPKEEKENNVVSSPLCSVSERLFFDDDDTLEHGSKRAELSWSDFCSITSA